MQSQRSRALRAAVLAVAACAAAATAAAPAAAAPQPYTTARTFRIDRRAGTCPASLTVTTRTRQYEGGAEFEITARTKPFAVPTRVISGRTPHRVEFVATGLEPRFTTCEATARFTDSGTTYQLALHDGTMRFVILLSPELQLVSARVSGGNPSVKAAVAD